MRILVVDDDPAILKLVAIQLAQEGYEVIEATSAEEALARLEHDLVDLAIVDVMMPGMNGFELTKILTKELDIAVILLTAKGQLHDKEQGFLAGTEDYVVKPFELRELLFRVAVIARRLGKEQEHVFEVGNVSIDREHYELTIDGKTFMWAMKEFELFLQLAKRANTIVKRELLIDEVWGGEVKSDLTLNTHINRVRERLRKHGAVMEIRTVRGIGYKLEVEA